MEKAIETEILFVIFLSHGYTKHPKKSKRKISLVYFPVENNKLIKGVN